MASSVNHTVRLPRRISAASYSGQFVTRYRAFGILWRRLSLNLYGMGLHNHEHGTARYPTVWALSLPSAQAVAATARREDITRRCNLRPIDAPTRVCRVSRSSTSASRSDIVVSTSARNASMLAGRLCRSVRGEAITQRILRGNRRFENPLCGLNTRPIEPVEQSSELDRRQP